MSLATLLALAGPPATAQAAPPLNDNFAAAELLTGNTVSAAGTNVEATKETGEPNHAGYSGGRSVWYRWVAPADGVVVVDAVGSSYYNVYSVYTGNTVDGLTRVAWEWATYSQRFAVKAGTVYHVAIDQRYSDSSPGTVNLNLSFNAAPPNDAFASAQELAGTEASATADTRGATREGGERSHAGYSYGSVWYTWTAPWTGSATIDTAGSNYNTTLGVYTGDTLGGLVAVASNDNASSATSTSRVVFHAVAGTTYRIAIDGASKGGDAVLSLRLRDPPANDAFATAVELPSESKLTATGRNDGATPEIGEPSHYSYDPARSSVWYRWTAPKDGSLTVKAGAVAFSPVLAAYRGTQVSDLTRVANQAQPCSCGPDQIRIRVDAGVTYWIAVDSRYAGTGGDFSLSLDLIDRPANDDFADAQLLVGVSVDVDGTNLGATQEFGEPVHEQNYYDPSVWYSWTAPATGGVTIDTAGSAFTTVTAVYTGDAVNALTRVPSTANSTASQRIKRSFRAVAGQTYRIAVDGAGAAQGDFKLALRFRPAPANDMFLAAEPLVAGLAVPGDNIGATAEPNEPNSGGTAGATVWYSWTAATTGPAKVVLLNKDFAATSYVYTGNTVDALTPVATESGLFRAAQGTTYRIAVTGGSVPQRGVFDIRIDRPTGPPNDELADAAELTGWNDVESGSSVNGTREPGEPEHVYKGRASVWYRWTAPATGAVTFDLAGSHYDMTGVLYLGDSVTSLTKLGVGRKIKINAEEGTTYRLAVDGEYGSTGNVRVTVAPGIVPPNDNFANAAELTGESDTETASTAEATRELNEPVHVYSGAGSVWYRWTAPRTGRAVIDITGSFSDASAVVYSGTSLSTLTRITSGRKVTFRAVQGTTYRIAIDGAYGYRGNVQLLLSMPPSPPNDEFDNAIELTGEKDGESGSNVNATAEPDEPKHVSSGGASVWYRWTAPRTGTVNITTTGTQYGLSTSVYTGSAVSSLTKVAGSYSSVTFKATEGTTYRIAVDGDYGNMSAFQIALAMQIPPANDNFADAVVLSGELDSRGGSTLYSSSEPGEPKHVYSPGGSVWYSWTAPRTGLATVDLTSSQYYMQAFVYTGDTLSGLSKVTSGKAIRFRAVAGQTYRIAVDSDYSYTAAFELRVAALASPANDDFANATGLTGEADLETGSNQNATRESGEPNPFYQGGSSVWYRWTAPRTAGVTIDLNGSSFDTQMSVYTGDSVGALSRVGQVRGKKLTFRAQEGTTYAIQVDGYYGATGSIQLALAVEPRPANDDFANAAAISSENATVAGHNMGATREVGEPVHYGTSSESVWYRWTAARNGQLRLNVTPTMPFTPTIASYRGTSLTTLSRIAATTQSMSFYVRKGEVVYIAIDGYSGGSGTFTVTTTFTPAPANDDFADAETLTGDHATDESPNANASWEPGEPPHSGRAAWNSLWYRWTAPSTGRATLDLTGSGFDTLSAVYTGSTISNLSEVASSDDYAMSFPVEAGRTYSIAVASKTGASGTMRLALDLVPRPANDDFAAAIEIAGESADAAGDNRAATAEGGEPAHWDAARNSVWWRWTAPSDGETTIDLSGSSFDTALAVYTGSGIASLTRVARDDEAGAGDTSRLTFTATEGTTYAVAVDSYGSGTGSVVLALRHVAAQEESAVERQQSEEPPADDPPAEDPPADDPPAEDPPAEDPPADDPPGEDPPVDDPPVDDPPVEDPPADDPRADDPPAEDPPVDDPPADDSSAEDPLAGDPPADDPAAGDPPVLEPPRDDPPAEDPPADDVPADDPPADEPPADDQPADDPRAGDPPADEPPVEDPPADDPPAEDPPADEPAANDPPAGDTRPATDQPAHDDAPVVHVGPEPVQGTVSPPPPQPSTGPAAPPSAGPLALSAIFGSQKLKAVLSKGLTGTVSCPAGCAVEATAALDPKAAKKLGLKAAGMSPFGSAAVQANGPTKVVFKLSAEAKRKLAKVKSLKLTIQVTARDRDGRTATLTRKLTIKR